MILILKNLDLALQVIRQFSHEKPTRGARELAKELNVNHTSIYRILETLKNNGFVIKNPETKKYSLGIPFIELGTIVKASLNLDELFRPMLQELCEKTHESIFLTTLDQAEGITLMTAEPQNRVKSTAFEGSRAPLYAGASYRSILAYQSDAFIDQVFAGKLEAFTSKTILDKSEYLEEFRKTREQEYVISQGEYTPDVIAVAVPIKDASNEVRASLTVSGPTFRFTKELQQLSLELLQMKRVELETSLKNLGIYF